MATYKTNADYSAIRQEHAPVQRMAARRGGRHQVGDTPIPTSGALSGRIRQGFASANTNHTGIPSGMKQRLEQSYGLPLDDVQVHYGSSEPEKLGAQAFTQGTQVHIGPGQEEHLGHELGHVIQQKRGRVAKTTSVAGVAVNDNSDLEREADRMGEGLHVPTVGQSMKAPAPAVSDAPVQMWKWPWGRRNRQVEPVEPEEAAPVGEEISGVTNTPNEQERNASEDLNADTYEFDDDWLRYDGEELRQREAAAAQRDAERERLSPEGRRREKLEKDRDILEDLLERDENENQGGHWVWLEAEKAGVDPGLMRQMVKRVNSEFLQSTRRLNETRIRDKYNKNREQYPEGWDEEQIQKLRDTYVELPEENTIEWAQAHPEPSHAITGFKNMGFFKQMILQYKLAALQREAKEAFKWGQIAEKKSAKAIIDEKKANKNGEIEPDKMATLDYSTRKYQAENYPALSKRMNELTKELQPYLRDGEFFDEKKLKYEDPDGDERFMVKLLPENLSLGDGFGAKIGRKLAERKEINIPHPVNGEEGEAEQYDATPYAGVQKEMHYMAKQNAKHYQHVGTMQDYIDYTVDNDRRLRARYNPSAATATADTPSAPAAEAANEGGLWARIKRKLGIGGRSAA